MLPYKRDGFGPLKLVHIFYPSDVKVTSGESTAADPLINQTSRHTGVWSTGGPVDHSVVRWSTGQIKHPYITSITSTYRKLHVNGALPNVIKAACRKYSVITSRIQLYMFVRISIGLHGNGTLQLLAAGCATPGSMLHVHFIWPRLLIC